MSALARAVHKQRTVSRTAYFAMQLNDAILELSYTEQTERHVALTRRACGNFFRRGTAIRSGGAPTGAR